MDKVEKAEIEKILSDNSNLDGSIDPRVFGDISSSLTALIIKWLEERKYDYYSESGAPVEMDKFEASAYAKGVIFGRSQLITELIGELR